MEPTDSTEARYAAKFAEYQDAMHAGAWRLGWSFFAVLVGLLPTIWLFVWMVGPRAWEGAIFHAPALMWLGVALTLTLVIYLLTRLYRKNLELDALKRRYLAELRVIKGLPANASASSRTGDQDAFRDDLQSH